MSSSERMQHARLRRAALALAAAVAVLAGTVIPAWAQSADESRAPSFLSARVVSGGVELRWLPPTADAASVDGYEILRRRPPGESSLTTLVRDTASTDTSYIDTTATAEGVRYTYRVKAIRGTQRSRWSNYASVLVEKPPPPPPPPLLGNLGDANASLRTSQTRDHTITEEHAVRFELGDWGQGYAIDSVVIDLAEAPSDVSVSLWRGGTANAKDGATSRDFELFEFENPSSLKSGLNTFTAPPGSFAYHNTTHFLVLNGFGDSMKIRQTKSNAADAGIDKGAHIAETSWVLRFALYGSRRDSGFITASLTRDGGGQETLSIGDDVDFNFKSGGLALIHGIAYPTDNSISGGSGLLCPHNLNGFSMIYEDGGTGLAWFKAPSGATVTGTGTHTINMPIIEDNESERCGQWRPEGMGAVFGQLTCNLVLLQDYPAAPGAAVVQGGRSVTCDPVGAVEGVQLHPLVKNLNQQDGGRVQLQSGGRTQKVISQGFSTGSNEAGYRLRAVGVNIEGSDQNGAPTIPDGSSSVSVALHRSGSGGAPGDKLFDFVSSDIYAAGAVSYFEAPPDTVLEPDTDYMLVWTYLSGTDHRLRITSSVGEDGGRVDGFDIADSVTIGPDLSEMATLNVVLEIAVYGEAVGEKPLFPMVKNLEEEKSSIDYTVGLTNTKVVSQGFSTGSSYTGFRLDGIGFDTASATRSLVIANPGAVSVAVWTESGGKPGTKLFDLQSPRGLDSNSTFFEAPPDTVLESDTDYVVVWSHLSGNTHLLGFNDPTFPVGGDIEIGVDPVGLEGFTVAEASYGGADVDNLAKNRLVIGNSATHNVLRFAVYGDVAQREFVEGDFGVGRDWFHAPEGLEVGDRFRLLFITLGAVDATSGDIEDYNAFVQREAARSYNNAKIQRMAHYFKAVVCTEDVDALTNTDMAANEPVQILWLDGGWQDRPRLIARSYDDFYHTEWVEERYGAYPSGNSTELSGEDPYVYWTEVWTGCYELGTIFDHPEDRYLGTTSPMGMAAVGTIGHPNEAFGPIGSSLSSDFVAHDVNQRRPVLAISPVLTVVR